jgi:MscS family membrane protein
VPQQKQLRLTKESKENIMNSPHALFQRIVTTLRGLTVCVALLMLYPTETLAQDPLSAAFFGGETTEQSTQPSDPYGRESPRSLVINLVAAFASGDADRIKHYLESSDANSNLAERLQKRLDSSGSLLSFAALSNEQAGITNDGLPLNEERIGTFRAQSGDIALIARRQTPSDAAPYWVVSADSIKTITHEDPAVVKTTATELLPEKLQETRIAGAPVADWLIIIALTVISLLSLRLIFSLILRLIRILVKKPETNRGYQFAVAAFPPLGLYILVGILFLNTQQLQVAIVARQVVSRYAGIVGWIAFVWFLWRLIDMVFDLWSARMARTERRRAMSALSLVRRSAKVALVMIAFIAVLNAFGINAMTGVAALGLGGLAVALGAQKTIENLVGSVAVIIDQPVRVGDFCKVGDVLGTVEDIGMRSTQLRTNERTVVTIPNGNFASKEIENYSRRDRFLFKSTIGLTYDTSSQKLRAVLDAILRLLINDENVLNDARVRFVEFNSSSLDIEIFAYILTHQYEAFLAMREALMLKIMDIIADEGASIAFPTRTIVMSQQDAI